jgi:hypothetical protein
MTGSELIRWLLDGDISIRYQTYRDLLMEDRPDLQHRIAGEGWGCRFLSLQNANGHWGRKFYQPKWTSTHYTLLDLKNLGITPEHAVLKNCVGMLLVQEKGPDGGINPSHNIRESDVCLNGMFLNYATYFGAHGNQLESIVDFIIKQQMDDGGFNCRFNRTGALHSSLHSTLSVLEGIFEYSNRGYKYRLAELMKAETGAREFILQHRLYISDRTGQIIDKKFLRLSYPSRWKYDILRALDYFRYAGLPFDNRLEPAVETLFNKRNKNGQWILGAAHPGQVHFEMEKTGLPSRWNTLRALRVLKYFRPVL